MHNLIKCTRVSRLNILLFIFFCSTLAGYQAHALNCAISAGANASTIQAAVDAAGTGSCMGTATPGTVLLAAGSYSVTSAITIPCGSTAIVITGPSQTYPAFPTAVINGSISDGWGLRTSGYGCTNHVTIQYLEWNGNHPSPQGGGMLYVAAGTNNLTYQYNYCHGMSTVSGSSYSSTTSTCLWVDGVDNSPGNSPQTDTGLTFSWNRFGNPATPGSNDCAAVMHQFGYSQAGEPASAYYQGPQSDYGHVGGQCAGIGIHSYTNTLSIDHNSFNNLEQGVKFYAPGSRTVNGVTTYYQFLQTNDTVSNNLFDAIHRIAIEAQQQGNPLNFTNNVVQNPFWPGAGTWLASVPQGSGTTNSTGNVMVDNVPAAPAAGNQPPGYFLPAAFEFWGHGINNQNLIQGYLSSGTAYGYGGSPWAATNNVIQLLYSTSYVSNEEGVSLGPAQSGNATGQILSALKSVAPTITVPGSCSGSASVTMSDAGYTNGVGPQGNHSIWYTTDGSTPTTSSSLYSDSITVACGTTVKAIGMWGAANQPKSYPAGYGFVPSNVVSAVYTGPSGPVVPVVPPVVPVVPVVPPVVPVVPPSTPSSSATLTGAYLGTPNNANTMVVGGALQFSSTGIYSDGTTALIPNSSIIWSSSNPAVLNVNSSGLVTATGAGVTNVNARIGPLSSSPWTVTVASAPPNTSGSGPEPGAPGAVVSDTFLGPFWETIKPAGGSSSISNGHLFIGVPGGSNHDIISPTNQAVRVMQTLGNVDFDVAIKIDSPLVATDAGTQQGLMVVADNTNFITYALTTDGSKIGLSANTITAGVKTSVLNDLDFSVYQNPMYLRLTKTGSSYITFYSVDGVTWTQAASFEATKVPTSVGPFASNYNNTPADSVPVVMSVNWFDVL
jgi:hypothetical protein